MSQRPYTLQDILGAINNDAGQAANPDVSPSEVLSNLAPANDNIHTKDTSVTMAATTASTETWDNSTWGFFAWS